jgi:hypothetical protein
MITWLGATLAGAELDSLDAVCRSQPSLWRSSGDRAPDPMSRSADLLNVPRSVSTTGIYEYQYDPRADKAVHCGYSSPRHDQPRTSTPTAPESVYAGNGHRIYQS